MELYDQIIEKMKKSAHEMKDSIPYIAYHSIYNDMQTKDIGWWTNSFYAGILWYLYLETSDDVYMQYAKSIEQKLDIVLNEGVEVDHDAGFMWTLTSKINYLLTKNEQSKSKTITAANYLVNRFEKGSLHSCLER